MSLTDPNNNPTDYSNISNTVQSATVLQSTQLLVGGWGGGLDLSWVSEQDHVVGQEVLPRYDQPTNLHQIKHDQEVVNTDPASDQHHGKAVATTLTRA